MLCLPWNVLQGLWKRPPSIGFLDLFSSVSCTLADSGRRTELPCEQVGGKLLVATTGGTSQKPSAVALLEVGSVDELIKSEAHQWQSIRLSTKSEVRTASSTALA